ncbi:hypothetical protein N657DRAFT_632394 [Parathielavia appendiculata]|uniref:Zn(2)-C6 fungal-type domain-containing protein n=1 Tax=Parathielavia appendiculata TaxID=2587402 RepID=A0AAN6Z5C7_9PEZI|nr:hypothetical protein N657DRAFT_632394 [Parathielavia appendiculata]
MELAVAEPAIGAESIQPAEASRQPPAPSPGSNVPGPPAPPSDTGADAGSEAAANPRKRKKASRACDFCHVNHQPCDNGKPKCSVCTKHNKPCLYLRPTKRRGPQKGYRTALNTYKESAAAWGAVLGAIPGLDTLIEGHLRGNGGKAIVGSIKDSNQQDALIATWQQSSVFRAFFGHNGPPPGLQTADSNVTVPSQEVEDEDAGDETPPVRPPPASKRISQPPASQRSQSVSSVVAPPEPKLRLSLESPFQPRDSLSDIVAKDAAQSATRASQTLASLGFAPDETIADFYIMGANPEPIPESTDPDFDPSLGTEEEQRTYYELLMGRSFPG